MVDFSMIMVKPFLACLILTGIHAYFGLHVIKREVIFLDLSLAQMAALGSLVALCVGVNAHSSILYWFSLGFTFIGAALFVFTRSNRSAIPQEVVIGIVYVVSAAFAVLVLHGMPEGDERIRHMLVGNILLVETGELIKMFILYSVVGIFHAIFLKQFWLISSDPGQAEALGYSMKKWDFLFYMTFGVVVTSSVAMAGVFLVFTFLIIPAAMAMFFASVFSSRLLLGWGFGTFFSLVGIMISYALDLPTGATIVCIFGAGMAAMAFIRR